MYKSFLPHLLLVLPKLPWTKEEIDTPPSALGLTPQSDTVQSTYCLMYTSLTKSFTIVWIDPNTLSLNVQTSVADDQYEKNEIIDYRSWRSCNYLTLDSLSVSYAFISTFRNVLRASK
jgi:hypothetical protein